jgi:Rps23 Pro-64 3,4-dihydroxylase Tpa1-like proline 4-hydroxylase
MKFEIIYEPTPIIIIRDLFSSEVNKQILAESISNEKEFLPSVTGGGDKEKTSEFRTNFVAFYDNIYDDRTKSILLESIDGLFSNNDEFKEVMASAPHPINEFSNTNYHETQVSRYGDKGQEYRFHIDAFNSKTRRVTMVYYFNEEPKPYTGGILSVTRSPIYDGNPIDETQKVIDIEPENNMAIIFGSQIPHRVSPTTSSSDFNKGRFSVNCWIGFR